MYSRRTCTAGEPVAACWARVPGMDVLIEILDGKRLVQREVQAVGVSLSMSYCESGIVGRQKEQRCWSERG